jgi:CRISPR-associated protein Cmr5
MTRQQRHMSTALANVQAVRRLAEDVQEIYVTLCHTVPILVRTSGLCQALALVEDKAGGSGPRGLAYQTLRQHLGDTLGVPGELLLRRVSEASLSDYVGYTRTLLDAWTYYKRFAVSILDVERGISAEERR